MKLKEEKGLTLVELLATLVILAIIATIAVLSIGQIIKNSEERAIVADAVQLIEAAKLAEANGDIPTTTGTTATYTLENLKEYLSGTSKKLTENLGPKPYVKVQEVGGVRTYELVTGGGYADTVKIIALSTTDSKYAPKKNSTYAPMSFLEEDLKKALEGKGEGNK